MVAGEMVLSTMKCLHARLCCLQRSSVPYRNYVVCNDQVLAAEIVLSAAIKGFVVEIVLSEASQWSLLKWCCF